MSATSEEPIDAAAAECARWLPILAKRLDDEQPRVRFLRRYLEQDAPLPEMGPNLRAAWQKFQRKARTTWAGLILDSVADRIVPIGIEIAGSTDSEEAQQAKRIWRDNRLDVVVKQYVRDGLAYRDAYLCVWAETDSEGSRRAVMTAESPEQMYAATDPVRPWIVRAAIKVWRDPDTERDYAYVWIVGGRQRFSRPTHTLDRRGRRRMLSRANAGTWEVDGTFEPYGGDIPVYLWQNPGGFGEFELHTDLIDRINHGVLERLVTRSMQAFRQRALKRRESQQYGGAGDDEDDDGNDVDYTKIFEPAPGALWDLPEGWEVWESQTTDFTPMVLAEKGDLRDLAAVTRTPLPMLVPDGANQTATGAAEMTSGLYFKTRDRVAVVRIALAAALLKALRVEGTEPSGTIEVLCEDPSRVSLAEKYAAAVQAKGAGESWKSIQRNILGRTPDQIRQDAADRAEEQLAAQLLIGSTPAQASRAAGGGDEP